MRAFDPLWSHCLLLCAWHLQSILAAQWSFPTEIPVSEDCRDLLLRLLVADPVQRLNMEDIQKHRWFRENLPARALNINDMCIANTDYSSEYMSCL